MFSLIIANIRNLFRLKSGGFLRLVISFTAICCVICTAYSVLSSLAMFFAQSDICEYVISIDPDTSTDMLRDAFDRFNAASNEAHSMNVCSPIDIYSSGPIMGIEKGDPGLIHDFGDASELENFGETSGKIWLDYAYIDTWNHLDFPIQEAYINGKAFTVSGVGDISFLAWKFIGKAEETGIMAKDAVVLSDSEGQPLPIYDSWGAIFFPEFIPPDIENDYFHPNFEQPVTAISGAAISLNDYMDADLPASYLNIVYDWPPSGAEHTLVQDIFAPLAAEGIDALPGYWETVSITSTLVLICLIAILLALLLMMGLVGEIEKNRFPIWNTYYICGCTKAKLIRFMGIDVALFAAIGFLLSIPIANAAIGAIIPYNSARYISILEFASIGLLFLMAVVLLSIPTLRKTAKLAAKNAG